MQRIKAAFELKVSVPVKQNGKKWLMGNGSSYHQILFTVRMMAHHLLQRIPPQQQPPQQQPPQPQLREK